MSNLSVKLLEWVRNGSRYLDASSIVGHYEIQLDGPAYSFSLNGSYSRETYHTLDAAKAAAQADYETRILSALSRLQEGEPFAYHYETLASTGKWICLFSPDDPREGSLPYRSVVPLFTNPPTQDSVAIEAIRGVLTKWSFGGEHQSTCLICDEIVAALSNKEG